MWAIGYDRLLFSGAGKGDSVPSRTRRDVAARDGRMPTPGVEFFVISSDFKSVLGYAQLIRHPL